MGDISKIRQLAPKHSGWINTSTAGKWKNICFSLGVKLSYQWLQHTFISECGKMSCFAWLLVSTAAPTFHHMFAKHNKRQLNWFKGHLLPWKLRVNLLNASYFFFGLSFSSLGFWKIPLQIKWLKFKSIYKLPSLSSGVKWSLKPPDSWLKSAAGPRYVTHLWHKVRSSPRILSNANRVCAQMCVNALLFLTVSFYSD